MTFLELAEKRCSIRSYKSDPVSDEALNQILTAGRMAPTAKNLQPFHYVIVRDSAVLDELAKAYPAPFFREAPVVIVICVESSKGWVRERYDGKNYAEVDVAIATDHMALAAADIGLGTCWIAAFDPDLTSKVLGLPDGVEPVVMLPVGNPNEEGREKNRKPIEELIRYDHW